MLINIQMCFNSIFLSFFLVILDLKSNVEQETVVFTVRTHSCKLLFSLEIVFENFQLMLFRQRCNTKHSYLIYRIRKGISCVSFLRIFGCPHQTEAQPEYFDGSLFLIHNCHPYFNLITPKHHEFKSANLISIQGKTWF